MVIVFPSTPFYVAFEVISSCNLNCTYCYAKPFTEFIPSLKNLEYLFKKTQKEVHPFEVNILGGEPFLRSDILELLHVAKNTFKWVGVSTNGTLIPRLTDSQMQELKKLNEQGLNIQVSLDSHLEVVHNTLRGGFRDTIAGMKRLDEYGIEYEVGIVITTLNADKIVDTVQWIISNFRGVKRVHLMNLMPSYSLPPKIFEKLTLGRQTPEYWRRVIDKLEELRKMRPDVQIDYPLTPNANIKAVIDDRANGLKSCLAGITRANVLANGDVTPCELVRTLKLGNAYKEHWRRIWKKAQIIIQKVQKDAINTTLENRQGLCFLINHYYLIKHKVM